MGEVAKANDYRNRLKDFENVEVQRQVFIEDVLSKLEAVTLELEAISASRTKEVSILNADLSIERDARRGLQEKNTTLLQSVNYMKQARSVLVLIDADADIYLFRDDLLTRGVQGGQFAAEQLVATVREHLVSLGSFEDAEKIPIIVKAYANLHGLAQALVRDRKLTSTMDMVNFWCGFSRRFPLVDFIDVGPGKEEADSKLREVLAHHLASPLCEHVLLACCHDAGYVPVLRQYSSNRDLSDRITMISSGPIRNDMASLGLQTSKDFEFLFGLVRPKSQPAASYAVALASSPENTSVPSTQSSKSLGTPVSNCDRLKPILYNGTGKRIDKPLSVHGDCVKEFRKKNLCTWHYLRADCTVDGCKKVHGFKRPLSSKNYDALWCISREGQCRKLSRHGSCEDDQCIYGHGFI